MGSLAAVKPSFLASASAMVRSAGAQWTLNVGPSSPHKASADGPSAASVLLSCQHSAFTDCGCQEGSYGILIQVPHEVQGIADRSMPEQTPPRLGEVQLRRSRAGQSDSAATEAEMGIDFAVLGRQTERVSSGHQPRKTRPSQECATRGRCGRTRSRRSCEGPSVQPVAARITTAHARTQMLNSHSASVASFLERVIPLSAHGRPARLQAGDPPD